MKDKSISQLKISIKKKMSINTQEQVAKGVGISQEYLSMILNGKRCPKNLKNILKTIESQTIENIIKSFNNIKELELKNHTLIKPIKEIKK